MSKNYAQLSSVQRYQIEALLKEGLTQKQIADNLEVHPSTISRELKRNVPKTGYGALIYRATIAEQRTSSRHKKKLKRIRFTAQMKQVCKQWMEEEKYSPELISVEGKRRYKEFVSHEAIYQWIWKCKRKYFGKDQKYRCLYELLKHGRRRQKRGNRNDKRGTIPQRVWIDQRPKEVLKRKRIGDLEVDLMVGKRHKSAILVAIDRTTLKIKLRKLRSKKSDEIKRVLIKAYRSSKYWLRTITFDNDNAFLYHQQIAEKLNIKTYFTRPYTSQDKGTVENRIGVLRRFLPKGTDLSEVSARTLLYLENKLNNRPVRKFNYQTPNQVFSNKIALIS